LDLLGELLAWLACSVAGLDALPSVVDVLATFRAAGGRGTAWFKLEDEGAMAPLTDNEAA
jgi:hypothetical protein